MGNAKVILYVDFADFLASHEIKPNFFNFVNYMRKYHQYKEQV